MLSQSPALTCLCCAQRAAGRALVYSPDCAACRSVPRPLDRACTWCGSPVGIGEHVDTFVCSMGCGTLTRSETRKTKPVDNL